jgi:hypothetical protein
MSRRARALVLLPDVDQVEWEAGVGRDKGLHFGIAIERADLRHTIAAWLERRRPCDTKREGINRRIRGSRGW